MNRPIISNASIAPAGRESGAWRRSQRAYSGRSTPNTTTAITTPHTGRSPKDKFVVEEPGAADRIWWEKNVRLEPTAFDRLQEDVRAYLDAREVYVQDLFAGADPAFRLPVRFITPNAWHALFVRNMFIRAVPAELAQFRPGFTVLHAPDFQADPARHGTRTATFVVLNLAKRVVLIGGTRYAGEMKKSIFTALNYLLPGQGVMSMHCSANLGSAGDTAVFFGLSGTGKTTLSADPTRLGFAVAVHVDPEILLVDEDTERDGPLEPDQGEDDPGLRRLCTFEPGRQAGLVHRLAGGHDAELDVAIDPPQVLPVEDA